MVDPRLIIGGLLAFIILVISAPTIVNEYVTLHPNTNSTIKTVETVYDTKENVDQYQKFFSYFSKLISELKL